MRRIQFIELHDQSWFPSSIRDEVTDSLQFGLNFLKAYAPIAPLLQAALCSSGSRSIVDMCSGGGGPWLDLSQRLQGDAQTGFPIVLSDKYPNLRAFQFAGMASADRIGFYPDPVDATNVPPGLKGFRTMFSTLHHFPPEKARAMLQNAVNAGEGIGTFDITRRVPYTTGLMLLWAFTPFLFTPLIRPFRWTRLLWTYVVPVIPFVLLFDGVVSCLRTYRPEELREIIAKLSAPGYQWETGEQAGASGRVPITYLIGYPRVGSILAARSGATVACP